MVATVDELPLRLGLLVGDAVHNYRSALDQLVFELAFMGSRGGTRPPGVSLEKTMFPGSETRSNFEGSYVQTTLLAGLTQKHRAQLKRFQPYRGGKLPPPHPISRLMDLSNDDKHRLTQPTLICPTDILLEIAFEDMRDCVPGRGQETWNEKILGRPLKPDTEIVRFPIRKTGPKPHVKVRGQIRTFIGFQDGTTPEDQLTRIGAYAREIVEFFAPEFDPPVATRLSSLPRPGRLTEPTDVPDATSSGGLIGPSGERIGGGWPWP